jgi:hypothetical protein
MSSTTTTTTSAIVLIWRPKICQCHLLVEKCFSITFSATSMLTLTPDLLPPPHHCPTFIPSPSSLPSCRARWPYQLWMVELSLRPLDVYPSGYEGANWGQMNHPSGQMSSLGTSKCGLVNQLDGTTMIKVAG